ncbi:hypothetical protein THRCLA_08623 [Thraustotheca clavata]|uniref:EF-hand domain-containing protein n=1 Tax=Thraustotheca clavata TaxID=74557 RepID=A0A1V9Z454_9STRA|nr:hypothetical protein THRCLA_08623 [Thraustotheca clavata]
MGNKQAKLKRHAKEQSERSSATEAIQRAGGDRKRSLFTRPQGPAPQPAPVAPPTTYHAPPTVYAPPPPVVTPPPPLPVPTSGVSRVHDDKVAQLRQQETLALVECTHFTAKEIDSIREHTMGLLGYGSTPDLQDSSVIRISKDDFMRFLGVSSKSLFPNRLYAFFTTNSTEELSFADLVKGLSVLSQKATREEKLRMAFQWMDPTGDGFITKETTMQMLKSCLEESKEIGLSDDQIEKLVISTFHEADIDKNGTIDFSEYMALDERHPGLLKFLTVDTSGVLSLMDKTKEGGGSFILQH